jgi:hypothetical protein
MMSCGGRRCARSERATDERAGPRARVRTCARACAVERHRSGRDTQGAGDSEGSCCALPATDPPACGPSAPEGAGRARGGHTGTSASVGVARTDSGDHPPRRRSQSCSSRCPCWSRYRRSARHTGGVCSVSLGSPPSAPGERRAQPPWRSGGIIGARWQGVGAALLCLSAYLTRWTPARASRRLHDPPAVVPHTASEAASRMRRSTVQFSDLSVEL